MKIAVTGTNGQVVTALSEKAGVHEVIPVGRPVLDLSLAETVEPALRDVKPDVIVSAAAYTAVDNAESDSETAFAINAAGAEAVAQVAALLDVPIIHLSTDYVFNGDKPTPYSEDDPTGPVSVYGRSKHKGEVLVQAANPNHVILRTAWVYSPFGSNFVKTMLRLAETHDELRIVADQFGNPTSAFDIADGVLKVAYSLLEREDDSSLRGIFHLAGSGETNWAGFAHEIFEQSKSLGGPTARVVEISSAEYPTPAPRPKNSRLDCSKVEQIHGYKAPDWRLSTAQTIARLLA